MKILSAAGGALVALMVWVNGFLSNKIGNGAATVVIHATGLIAIVLFECIAAKGLRKRKTESASAKHAGWIWYLGGVIGVATTVFSNASVGTLGVTTLTAVSLMGQVASAMVIDAFGWFGVAKEPVTLRQMASAGCIVLGIAAMLWL